MFRLEFADRETLLAACRAMSSLLDCSGPQDASQAIQALVRELGGSTVAADVAPADALPLDLSVGSGRPLLCHAPENSVARGRLEVVLPVLVEQAVRAVTRAGHGARLAEQVDVDWLTGLLNKRGSVRLLRRLQTGSVVALLDLDHFKQLNDTHGHAAGDAVLTAFGRVLLDNGRAQDRYARIGGEEFLGVFPAGSVEEVLVALERIRSAWEVAAPHPVTFSGGVAVVESDGGSAALARADAAMYQAKAEGRNRVQVARTGIPVPRSGLEERALPPLADSVEAVLKGLSQGDAGIVADVVHDLLDIGAPAREVVTGVLAPVQREVGLRWQHAVWTVADEHAATGAVFSGLAAVVFRASGKADGTPPAGRVAIVCPEGEWHELPARMFGVLLEKEGFAVDVLGPSVPAADLERALSTRGCAAVVLSCTAPVNLPAACVTIASAHRAGLPVVAGGYGFGTTSFRAERLGADGWAPDLDGAAALLADWLGRPPVLRTAPVPGESLLDVLGRGGLEAIRGALPPEAGGAATDAWVLDVVRHVDAALIVQDPTLLAEFMEWTESVQRARGARPDSVRIALDAMVSVLGPSARVVSRLLDDAGVTLATPAGSTLS